MLSITSSKESCFIQIMFSIVKFIRLIILALNDYCTRWCKREHVESNALNNWKLKSQTAALPRTQEEQETEKSKQAQTEQTYEKH